MNTLKIKIETENYEYGIEVNHKLDIEVGDFVEVLKQSKRFYKRLLRSGLFYPSLISNDKCKVKN